MPDSKQIEIKTTNKYTVITVVNYSFYQGADSSDRKQNSEQGGNQTGEQVANKIPTIEEIEEDKEFNKLRREYIVGRADAQSRLRLRTGFQ